MKNEMTTKDKKAYKRYMDETELRTNISQLLRDFSEKYDVECVSIYIKRNEFYGKNDINTQPPMYLLDLHWVFDYMSH